MKNLTLSNARGLLHKYFLLFLTFLLLLKPLAYQKAYAFSVGEEKEIGEKLLSMVRKKFDIIDAPDINQYINSIGAEILEVAGTQFFDYLFFTIKNKDFNAFAAPSGLIFTHSGLIEAMDTEEELIAVIAHECGHVTSRHIANRIDKSTKTSIATAALLITGIAMGGGALSEALITGSVAANASLNLRFSRQDEEEADRLAFKWMQKIGANPASMSSMLHKMHKISIYRMANIPPYLLTHPEPKRRMGYIQDLMFINNDATTLPNRDNFNFLRIKNRVLSITHKPKNLKTISLRLLEKAGHNTKEAAMAHYGLYLTYLNEAEYKSAETELKKVIAEYKDKSILITDMGRLFYKKGDYLKALDFFNNAHKADPTCAFTKFYLAKTWQQLKKDRKALRLYQDLLVQSPENSKFHYQIGQIKTKQNDPGAGHYHLGLYFWYEGDAKMAKFHLKQAISDKNTSVPLIEKAKAFRKKIHKLETS